MTESASLAPTNFDKAVRLLVTTMQGVHDSLHGTRVQKLWFTYVGKFLSAYMKADCPEGFHDTFRSFLDLYAEHMLKPIFYESEGQTLVNDGFLKVDRILPLPGTAMAVDADGVPVATPPATSTKATGSWSPRDLQCKGVVIYFRPSGGEFNPRFSNVSIGIGEAYQAAVKLYTTRQASDAKARSFPSKILLGLYAACYYVCDEADPRKAELQKNVCLLAELVDRISPTESGDGVGDALGGISQIMASVMKQSGMGSEINADGLKAALGSALTGGALENVGKVVGEIMKTVNEGEAPSDIGGVISRVGVAFQSESLRTMVAETAQQASDLMATIPGMHMAPAADVAVDGSSAGLPAADPSTQE